MRQSLATYNKCLLLGLIPLVLFSATIFSFNLNKPFNLDEADFACAAHSLLDDARVFSKRPEMGLWHPPLYIYTLAAAFKIFGETTMTARALGLLYYILTFIFLFLILRELFAGKQFYVISFIAASLYLINPLLIQYSLLIDIDGGLLVLAMIAFSYLFIRFNNHRMGPREIFFLGFLFGSTLLVKFTTPPLIIAAIFLFYILRRNYKNAFLYSFLIILIGIVSAWSIWYFYCRIFNIPLSYPFKYTLSTKWGQGGLMFSQQKIMNVKCSLLYYIWWISPAFAALMILSIYNRVGILIKQKSIERIDFLLILGSLVWFFYFICFPRLAMMKYQVVLYPLFIIVIAHFIFNILMKDSQIKGNEIILILTFGVFALTYYLFLFPDMVLWLQGGKSVVSNYLRGNYHLFKSLYLAPFFILPFIFYFLRTRKDLFSSFTLTLLLLTVAAQLSQDIKQIADYTTANSWYNYGEAGQAEAIDYLNSKLPPDGVAIVRKDIGYYLKTNPQGSPAREWIYNSLFRLPKTAAQFKFKKLMEKYDIKYVQLDNTCSLRNGHEIIKPYFTFDKRFGNFIVLKKR